MAPSFGFQRELGWMRNPVGGLTDRFEDLEVADAAADHGL